MRPAGSSPLTRGKPADRALSGKWSGLIPAHAGKTTSARTCGSGRRAHPRSRGENLPEAVRIVGQEGSSPLTRGKRWGRGCRLRGRGLIPAHAGKTGRAVTSSSPATAHPRSRGENNCALWATRTTTGSSPLTRGKPWRKVTPDKTDGLIPAHAGKTVCHAVTSQAWTAHPRSRGENMLDSPC